MGDFLFAIYSNHQNNSSKKVYMVVAEAMTLKMFFLKKNEEKYHERWR